MICFMCESAIADNDTYAIYSYDGETVYGCDDFDCSCEFNGSNDFELIECMNY